MYLCFYCCYHIVYGIFPHWDCCHRRRRPHAANNHSDRYHCVSDRIHRNNRRCHYLKTPRPVIIIVCVCCVRWRWRWAASIEMMSEFRFVLFYQLSFIMNPSYMIFRSLLVLFLIFVFVFMYSRRVQPFQCEYMWVWVFPHCWQHPCDFVCGDDDVDDGHTHIHGPVGDASSSNRQQRKMTKNKREKRRNETIIFGIWQ